VRAISDLPGARAYESGLGGGIRVRREGSVGPLNRRKVYQSGRPHKTHFRSKPMKIRKL